ncbi:hypothetical protein AOE01nite_16170 [Acetobacter oeni]|uniref:Uncharacterized protein n=1 Tax=Acetobacter oeni TaxID=304077 RepID=A0A511XKC2_9PROT|nr:hypothetical protein AA21952_1095 [Acetobacter oeni LMG 21952]GEN63393.1 hypothetical protein AOE01nite_16170 [Acetobacter oeni]
MVDGENQAAAECMFQTGQFQRSVSGVITGEEETAGKCHDDCDRVEKDDVSRAEAERTDGDEDRGSTKEWRVTGKQELATEHFLRPDGEQWLQDHERAPE